MRPMLGCTCSLLLLLAAAPATAQTETCYQLSRDGKVWSRTPELLCVTPVAGKEHKVALRTGIKPVEIAVFNLSLLKRVRCIDCNKDELGVENPQSSVFNELMIKFDGKREAGKPASETGQVSVGKTTFSYRSYRRAKGK